MTVQALIDKLSTLSPNDEVKIAGIFEIHADGIDYEYDTFDIAKIMQYHNSQEKTDHIILVPDAWIGKYCLRHLKTKKITDKTGKLLYSQTLTQL